MELLWGRPTGETFRWRSYAMAILVVALCTLVAALLFSRLEPTNLCMIYLVGVVAVASRYGRGPSILASLLSVAAFDFFFIPPYLTFVVRDTQYVITFAVMLLVAIVISTLTVQINQQAQNARERERRTTQLYAMSREFANNRSPQILMRIAAQHIGDVFRSRAVMLLPDEQHHLIDPVTGDGTISLSQHEQGVAQWVFDHALSAGWGTERLPGVQALFVPLVTSRGTVGVLGIFPVQGRTAFSQDQMRLLETFVNQATVAIERALLTEETEQARVQIETERLRNALLSSVSHDLRTPLAAITGAVSSLLDKGQALDTKDRQELAQVAYEEAERLNRLVGNLLEMTSLEAGGVQVEKEWELLEEVVGATLNRLRGRLDSHAFKANLPADLPLIPMDSVLIEQVLLNLLDNAIKYTPPGCPIDLTAQVQGQEVIIGVADRGPGLRPGEEQRVFDKFYRAQPATVGGVGLGLTICRGIVEAHGGRIWAENRPGGGATFCFTLPLGEKPPEMKAEDG